MSESTYPSVKDLTLEEKASLTSGGDAWHLQGVESKGIPGYMITDGPHGLRKSLASSTGETDLDDSVPATCFPPAAGLSSSWNPELIHKVGEAMAEECIQEKVAVILGPGVNIKRNPLGGRCFEYWSEDPYLAGHEAIGIVEGVQSKGVGTSLKHFAANNQETDRLRVDARISPRALREIYFPAFEYIVKKAQPWTIMCSYNRINGVHSAQNHWLLTNVLRDEWGFEGIVMSDWGADHDRGASLNAGLNLEMPPSYTDDQIVYAVRDGRITPAQLDRMAQGMIDLVNKTRAAMSIDNYRFDVDVHDEVAHQAAIESIVMLKNDDAILPLNAGPVANPSATPQKIAVIGEFARTPRYQAADPPHHPRQDDQLPRHARRARHQGRLRPRLHARSGTGRPGPRIRSRGNRQERRRCPHVPGLPEAAESEASTATPSTCPPSRSPYSNRSPPQTRTSWSCCPTVP